MTSLKEDFKQIDELTEKGLYLQAYNELLKISPVKDLGETEEILTASNIVFNLGADDLSRKLTLKAWRRDKTHPRTIFYKAMEIFSGRGPLPALIFLRKNEAGFRGDARITGWWYSLFAQVFASLHDFRKADLWHRKAAEVAPEEQWVWVAKAYILENQDRYQEALEVSRKAFQLNPLGRTGLQTYCHLLSLLERDREALEILTGASEKMENVWILKHLGDLQNELSLFAESYATFQKINDLIPVREEKLNLWLYASLSDAAYLNGDDEKAIEYAGKIKSKYYEKILQNLKENDPSGSRKLLPLGFIRQHQMTCAPATLSNISRFWGKKAEHLEVADQISYDGTPAYKERLWAERNGWEAREFTVNWEDSLRLTDLGIPYTLATVQPGNGHLQAIVGYDERRKTFLVRDPFFHHIGEMLVEALLEDQSSGGPRGMALVPSEKSSLLENIELKDSGQYDFLYRLEDELDRFDRNRASAVLEEMEKKIPDRRLTLFARWALARYDANDLMLKETVEKLLKQFPDDINFKLSYLNILNDHAPRPERLQMLEEYSLGEKTDPLIWQMFGYELGQDADQHKRALRWHFKVLRRLPTGGLSYRFIADILWAQRRFEAAAELYRFAACLNDKDEQFAYSYFLAERHLKKTDRALKFLRDRFERFGRRSNLPVQSLFHALREIDRTVEAFEALDRGMEKRPEDGELMLFAAEAKARFGQKEEALHLLEKAREKAPRGNWLRKAALIEELRGNFAECLAHWREIVRGEPLAYDAHESIALVLTSIEGPEAARNYLRKVTRNFPYNKNLHRLRLAYLAEKNTEAIAVLRHLVGIDPRDAWCQRELSRWLIKVKKFDRALEAARTALEIGPNEPLNQWALGNVLAATGNFGEAGDAFKRALSLSVDADYALADWIENARTLDEKLAILRFVREELELQTNFGQGILAYHSIARRLIEPEKLLEELRKIHRSNDDLWQASSVITQQLVDLHRLDEGLEMALKTTEKFPLIHQVWYDLSTVHKVRGENESEIEALRRALEIFENWSFGLQRLAEALERGGKFEEAADLLREALGKLPLDHFLLGYLADILWKLGEKEEAIETAQRAVTLEPEYVWAWQMIRIWSEELEKTELAVDLARQLTKDKPKDVRAWVVYARMLETTGSPEERLEALENALKLDPGNVQALAIKANVLAEAGRVEEAFEVCRTESADGQIDDQLRFVRARIESLRGNQEESVRQLEELTIDSPDYYPAWEILAGIYSEWEEKKIDYLRVSRGLVRLDPQNHIAYGYLGEAFLQLKKRSEAKEAFGRALTLFPEYEFAALQLFDLHFEDDEVDECRSVLAILKKFIKNENALVREIILAGKVKDRENCRILWRELCLSEKAENGHFKFVLEHFGKSGLKNEPFISEVLRRVCSEENVNPLVGSHLIGRVWEEGGETACLRILSEVRSNSKLWSRAIGRFLEILLENKSKSEVYKFIAENSRDLRADTEAWGSTGFVLNALQLDEAARSWFSDWADREDLLPWMIWNYSIVLRRMGDRAEAIRVNRRALEIKPDFTVGLHQMMVGLEAVYAGNYDEAQKALINTDPRVMSYWDRFFFDLLEKSLEIWQLTLERKQKEAEDRIRKLLYFWAFDPEISGDRVMRDNFDLSLNAALHLCESKWFRFRIKVRRFVSRFNI
ncbi:MAG: tetratricopeptide repeat protein [Pyrinomonadaceae bacterium]